MMMKKLTAFISVLVISLSLFSVSVSAKRYDEGKVFVSDKESYLSDSEFDDIVDTAEKLSDKTGYNVGIIITDDIGSKSPVAFSDDAYMDVFSKNSDGFMILLNNDTYEDHISTAGNAILMYSDARLMNTLDSAGSYLKEEDFYSALKTMLGKLDSYYDAGVPAENEGYTKDDIENATGQDFLGRLINIFHKLGISFVIFIVVSIVTFFIVKSSYRFKTAESARTYVNKSETFFREKSDTFIREYTTSHKISSDSSGGGSRGGGSGRVGGSSVHRSSGGGSFGGASRKR
ncbi:MAG: TPM domain-containing protein [Oscillospiraceae bacterium]|nr:TPM domain-containing protein [Oscillospiraceae bacterium]